jgi:multiple sugar transport system permease protein
MISYRQKQQIGKLSVYILLTIAAFITLFPLIIVLSSSFKNESELFNFPFRFIPEKVITTNFLRLMDRFPRYIWNSVKLTTTIVIVQLFTAATGHMYLPNSDGKEEISYLGCTLPP